MYSRKLVSQNFSVIAAGNNAGDVYRIAAFRGSYYIMPPNRGPYSPYWGLLTEGAESLGLDLGRTLPPRLYIDREGTRVSFIRWLYGAAENSADYAAVEAAIRAELARVADLSAARRVYNRLRPEGEPAVYDLSALAAYWAAWMDTLQTYRPPVWGDLGLTQDGELAVYHDGHVWTRSPRGWGRDVTPEDYSSWGVRPLDEGGWEIVDPGLLPPETLDWLQGVDPETIGDIGNFFPPPPWRWEGHRLRLPLNL